MATSLGTNAITVMRVLCIPVVEDIQSTPSTLPAAPDMI